ncbi:MAG: hypothetical protein HZC28_08545 [Spirochaetes bacterium]|nr:hypothetical protein [Spirochaetota bacterium]
MEETIKFRQAFSTNEEYSIERISDDSGRKQTRYKGILSERRAQKPVEKRGSTLAAQIDAIEESGRNGYRYPILDEKKTFIRKWTQFGEPILLSLSDAIDEISRYGYPKTRIKEMFEETFYIQIPLLNPAPTFPDYDESPEFDTITYCIEQN